MLWILTGLFTLALTITFAGALMHIASTSDKKIDQMRKDKKP